MYLVVQLAQRENHARGSSGMTGHSYRNCTVEYGQQELDQLHQFMSFILDIPYVELERSSLAILQGLGDDRRLHLEYESDSYRFKINPKDYSYTYTIWNSTILIHERHINVSQGGATFKVTYEGQGIIDVCWTIDLRNGTYEVKCPRCDECTRVVVYLYMPNFGAYITRRTTYNYTHLFTIQTLHNKSFDTTKTKTCHIVDFRAHGRIIHSNDSSQRPSFYNVPLLKQGWVTWQNGDCVPSHVNKGVLEQCLSYIDRIILTGNSQLRFLYYYMLDLLEIETKLPKKLYDYHSIRNLEFHWSAMLDEVISVLRKDSLHRPSRTSPKHTRALAFDRILLLNTMHWELAFNHGPFTYISKFGGLLDAINRLQRRDPRLRIIWIGGVPVADTVTPGGWRELRKLHPNPMRAALNKWTSNHLVRRGVEVFDQYRMLYGLSEETPDNKHYLSIDPANKSHNASTGDIVGNMLLHFICQPTIIGD